MRFWREAGKWNIWNADAYDERHKVSKQRIIRFFASYNPAVFALKTMYALIRAVNPSSQMELVLTFRFLLCQSVWISYFQTSLLNIFFWYKASLSMPSSISPRLIPRYFRVSKVDECPRNSMMVSRGTFAWNRFLPKVRRRV